jgi:phosphomannomutase
LLSYIQSYYEKEKLDILTIDGVRIQGDGRRYCLRKSGTEDIVKLCMEAKDQALFDKKLAEIRGLIIGYGGHEE